MTGGVRWQVTEVAVPRTRNRSRENGADDARAAPALLSVRNVTVTYANGTTAVRDASFELQSGTICGLVGVNGSGKSTLFKAIMGFVIPSTGEVRINGLPMREAMRANIVAYVPQSEEVDWNFPVLVEDVVMMGRYGHMGFLRIPSKTDHAKVSEALERVGMSALRKRQIGELSGGQRKRVFLAWASPLPGWMSRPRRKSSISCGSCGRRGKLCSCRHTTSAACPISATRWC